MRVGLAALYLAIGLTGGFAIGWGSHAWSVGDFRSSLIMPVMAMVMLALVCVSIVVQARLRRKDARLSGAGGGRT